MFKLRVFKSKRRCGQSRITRVLEKLPDLLNVNENDYDVYTETGDVVVYRVEFKEPVKMSENGYNKLIRFLWRVNKDVEFVIIEDKKNTVVCGDCYDLKIYIDREVVDGSIYVKGIRFETEP